MIPARQFGSHGSRMIAGSRVSSQRLLLFLMVNGIPVGMSRRPGAPLMVQAAVSSTTPERSGSVKRTSFALTQVVSTSTSGFSKITDIAEAVEFAYCSKFSPRTMTVYSGYASLVLHGAGRVGSYSRTMLLPGATCGENTSTEVISGRAGR